MQIDMQMNGLRRNDEAMKINAGIQKTITALEHLLHSFLIPTVVFHGFIVV